LVKVSIGKEKEKRDIQLNMKLLQITLGRGRVTFSLYLSLYLYSLLNEVGVFEVGLDVFLFLFWSIQNQFYPSLLAP
jgi:hypothetical protein